MEHNINAVAGFLARRQIGDIAFDELKAMNDSSEIF